MLDYQTTVSCIVKKKCIKTIRYQSYLQLFYWQFLVYRLKFCFQRKGNMCSRSKPFRLHVEGIPFPLQPSPDGVTYFCTTGNNHAFENTFEVTPVSSNIPLAPFTIYMSLSRLLRSRLMSTTINQFIFQFHFHIHSNCFIKSRVFSKDCCNKTIIGC